MRHDEATAGERAKTKDRLESSNQPALQKIRKNRNQNVLARSLPEKRPQHQMNHISMIFDFSVREKTANEKKYLLGRSPSSSHSARLRTKIPSISLV